MLRARTRRSGSKSSRSCSISTRKIRLGSRGSKLALAQAELAIAALGVDAEVVVITTRGDRMKDSPYSALGPKGVFAAELQHALAAGEIDVAVHSLKDLAGTEPDGLAIAAVLERADVRDVVVGRALSELAAGARVGTSALRRSVQLATMRPDIEVLPMRGNVDTRLQKVARGEYDAAVLAGAGLIRLGLAGAVAQWLDPLEFLPAPGQGAIALETRHDDAARVAAADHPQTRAAVEAERAFMRAMEGGCDVALGAWGRVEGGRLVIDGWADGSGRGRHEGRVDDPEDAGRRLAETLR